MKPNYQFFLFQIMLFRSNLRILCLALDPEDSIIFFPPDFSVLCFSFKSIIYSGFIFVYRVRLRCNFFSVVFCPGMPTFSGTVCWKGCISSMELLVHLCQNWARRLWLGLFLSAAFHSIMLCVSPLHRNP